VACVITDILFIDSAGDLEDDLLAEPLMVEDLDDASDILWLEVVQEDDICTSTYGPPPLPAGSEPRMISSY